MKNSTSIVTFFVGLFYCGCGPSVQELEHRNAMQFKAAVLVIAKYQMVIDSLNTELDECRDGNLLRSKNGGE